MKYVKSFQLFEANDTVNMYLTNYLTVAKKHAKSVYVINDSCFNFLHKDGAIYQVKNLEYDDVKLYISMNSVYDVISSSDKFEQVMTLTSAKQLDKWLENQFQTTVEHWKKLVEKDPKWYLEAPAEILDVIRPKLAPLSRIGIFEQFDSNYDDVVTLLKKYAYDIVFDKSVMEFNLVDENRYTLRYDGLYYTLRDANNLDIQYSSFELLKDAIHALTIKYVLIWKDDIEDDPSKAMDAPAKVLQILKHKLAPASDYGIFED